MINRYFKLPDSADEIQKNEYIFCHERYTHFEGKIYLFPQDD